MSFFIDKHGRRKSPIALAACGAALLDLAVYFCTAALLAGPLYRTVSFGGETVTSMLHTIIITVISTLLCCLLFLLKDKRVVPYGFAGLAVILLMFCAAAWMLPQETRGSGRFHRGHLHHYPCCHFHIGWAFRQRAIFTHVYR